MSSQDASSILGRILVDGGDAILRISVDSIEVGQGKHDFADFTDLISDAHNNPSGSAPPVCEITVGFLPARALAVDSTGSGDVGLGSRVQGWPVRHLAPGGNPGPVVRKFANSCSEQSDPEQATL